MHNVDPRSDGRFVVPSTYANPGRSPANDVATAASPAQRMLLVDGIAAVGAAIDDGRWLEAVALIECLVGPARVEGLRHAPDPDWSTLVDEAIDEWRALRNEGVEWYLRQARADMVPRVTRDSTLWQAAYDGYRLVAGLCTQGISRPPRDD